MLRKIVVVHLVVRVEVLLLRYIHLSSLKVLVIVASVRLRVARVLVSLVTVVLIPLWLALVTLVEAVVVLWWIGYRL